MQNRKLLLLSSSRLHGTEFLEHCGEAIADHFQATPDVMFVPYALADHDQYEKAVAEPFQQQGLSVHSLHRQADPVAAIDQCQAIFIGGGNSFRLLKALYDLRLIEPLRQAVARGAPYMGSSAGTNMACPTIRTTNDMPIVEPPSFDALQLIPFQINPHYLDADPDSTHQGETRAERLAEFHEENTLPVAALREGSWLRIDGDRCLFHGLKGMVLFEQGAKPREIDPDTDVSFLLVDPGAGADAGG